MINSVDTTVTSESADQSPIADIAAFNPESTHQLRTLLYGNSGWQGKKKCGKTGEESVIEIDKEIKLESNTLLRGLGLQPHDKFIRTKTGFPEQSTPAI